MAKAISLHVGVNIVGPIGPTSQPLVGAVNDARAMYNLPALETFDRRELLVDDAATLQTVITRITAAASDLDSGGIFVFTFAGHGSFIGDEDQDERDHNDETLVLYDYMLSDDVLGRDLWPTFKPNTRILMIADSCYSGTVFEVPPEAIPTPFTKPFSLTGKHYSIASPQGSGRSRSSEVIRTISENSRLRHIWANREFYDKLSGGLPENPNLNPSIILLAACRDHETTQDGNPHGVFTQALLDALRSSPPPAHYDDLINEIRTRLRGRPQMPMLSTTGQHNPAFLAQRPFTI